MANTGNTQQQINYGATANDGLGDPLRTAFIKVDENFDNIWLAGPVGSNITIGNNTIQVNNTNGNLVLQPNGVGIIQANASVVPSANNIRDLGSSSSRWRRAYIQNLSITNLEVPGDAVIAGNLTVEGDTIQIGNIVTDTLRIQLANTAANGAQANGAGITVGADDDIATILYNADEDHWDINIGIIAPGIVVNSIRSDDSSFVSVQDGIYIDGPIDAVGTVSAPYFVGNGSLLTGIATYGNADVAAYLPVYSGNIAAGNITVANSTLTKNLEITKNGETWYWNGDLMLSPAGGSWFSNPSVQEEYISSGVDGFLTLQSLGAGPTFQVESEINLEHGKVRIGVFDGSNKHWDFQEDGTLDVPGNILPQANAVQSLGNVNLQWAELWVANNTIYLGGVPIGISDGNVLTVGGEPILSNDSNTSITTTGNIAANAILTDNYFYANGEPFVSSSLGNLTVNDTRLEISTGATETSMFIGNGPAGLAMNQDSSSDTYLKLYANTTGSEFFNQGSDYSSGSYTSDGGSGGLITLNGAPNIEQFLNDLNFPGTIASVTINGTDTVPYDGAGWGGGTVNINTTTPPAVDPTVISSLAFNIVYVNQFVMDEDEGDFGIYIGEENFEIESLRDVRIVAGDDFSIESTDGFDLRSRDTDPNSGIRLTTNYSNANHAWLFRNDSALVLPQGGNIIGTTLNNSGSLQWVGNSSGDGYGYTTLVLRPDDTVSADQSIVIDPTFPNHIHIRAGGTQDDSGASLFLGGESSYFQVSAGLNPTVYVSANSNTWTFDTDGVLYAPGDISTSGNVTAGYFIGNGSQLTGLPASYGNANVATFLAAFGSNSISTTGNVTAGVLISSGSIYGNIDLILGNIANASGTKTRITTFGTNSYIQTGNGTVGSTGNIVFAPYLDSTEKVVIDTATGNVTAANFIGNISITGNVTGTSPNVTLVAGSYSYTFDNAGTATLPAVGGDEGGQLNFGVGSTNTTITGPVTVDVYRDKIRFFEGSVNARGVYLDLAKAPAGVGGELSVKASGMVNAGVDVTLGNLKVRVSSSGNRSLQVSTVSGTYSVYGSNVYQAGGTGGGTISDLSPLTITTTPAYLNSGLNFTVGGYMDTWTIMDTGNTIAWRITVIFGASYINNLITIERLL